MVLALWSATPAHADTPQPTHATPSVDGPLQPVESLSRAVKETVRDLQPPVDHAISPTSDGAEEAVERVNVTVEQAGDLAQGLVEQAPEATSVLTSPEPAPARADDPTTSRRERPPPQPSDGDDIGAKGALQGAEGPGRPAAQRRASSAKNSGLEAADPQQDLRPADRRGPREGLPAPAPLFTATSSLSRPLERAGSALAVVAPANALSVPGSASFGRAEGARERARSHTAAIPPG